MKVLQCFKQQEVAMQHLWLIFTSIILCSVIINPIHSVDLGPTMFSAGPTYVTSEMSLLRHMSWRRHRWQPGWQQGNRPLLNKHTLSSSCSSKRSVHCPMTVFLFIKGIPVLVKWYPGLPGKPFKPFLTFFLRQKPFFSQFLWKAFFSLFFLWGLEYYP